MKTKLFLLICCLTLCGCATPGGGVGGVNKIHYTVPDLQYRQVEPVYSHDPLIKSNTVIIPSNL